MSTSAMVLSSSTTTTRAAISGSLGRLTRIVVGPGVDGLRRKRCESVRVGFRPRNAFSVGL